MSCSLVRCTASGFDGHLFLCNTRRPMQQSSGYAARTHQTPAADGFVQLEQTPRPKQRQAALASNPCKDWCLVSAQEQWLPMVTSGLWSADPRDQGRHPGTTGLPSVGPTLLSEFQPGRRSFRRVQREQQQKGILEDALVSIQGAGRAGSRICFYLGVV